MRKLISLKLLIAFSINLIAPAVQCGKNHYKLTQQKNYRNNEFSYIDKLNKKRKRKKKKQWNILEQKKENKKKQELLQKIALKKIFLPKKKESLRSSLKFHSTHNKLLSFLILFLLLTPAFSICLTGKHRFMIYNNDYDAVSDQASLLLNEKVNCHCVYGGPENRDVLVCDKIYAESSMCESGTKIAMIQGPPFSGYYLKPMVVYIQCDCFPDMSIICYPNGVPGGLEEYVTLFNNNQAPTFLKTASQISSIATNIFISGCITIVSIGAAATALALYCKYKKARKKKKSTLINNESNTSSVTFHEIPNKSTDTDSAQDKSTESESYTDTNTESNLSSGTAEERIFL